MSDMSEMAALALLAIGVFWAGLQKDSKPIEVMDADEHSGSPVQDS